MLNLRSLILDKCDEYLHNHVDLGELRDLQVGLYLRGNLTADEDQFVRGFECIYAWYTDFDEGEEAFRTRLMELLSGPASTGTNACVIYSFA